MMEMGAASLEISDELARRLDEYAVDHDRDPDVLLDSLINSALDDAGAPSIQPDDESAVLF